MIYVAFFCVDFLVVVGKYSVPNLLARTVDPSFDRLEAAFNGGLIDADDVILIEKEVQEQLGDPLAFVEELLVVLAFVDRSGRLEPRSKG